MPLVAEPCRGLRGSDRGCSFPPLHPRGETHRKSWADLAPVGTTMPKFRHLHALLPRHGKAGPGGTGAARTAPAGEALTDPPAQPNPPPPPASSLQSIKSPSLNKTRCQ